MYVYFIRSNSEPPAVKVGKSNTPEGRMTDLQVSCPHRLQMLGKVLCWTEEKALQFESKIHNELQQHRLSGEWFALNDEVQARIAEFMARRFDKPAPLSGRKKNPKAAHPHEVCGITILKIPDAAEKYGVEPKRLRGAVYVGTQCTGRFSDPIGDPKQDLVQDDLILERWVEKQKKAATV